MPNPRLVPLLLGIIVGLVLGFLVTMIKINQYKDQINELHDEKLELLDEFIQFRDTVKELWKKRYQEEMPELEMEDD